ncbi:restriction endonuclease subunit S [Leptospira interrogans]|uniref:restriction endonuclease subunit S n=1 Tax=Leptospira interrogans TaxID=173 RepID=UPI0020C5381F|nr:restriction endonuclease subunit S [Leptospira interrogans]
MRLERLGDILTIQKGKKHSIAHDITTSSTRLLQIEDLRNDNQLKYTNDTNGVLATEEDLMIVWDGANAGTVGYGKRGFIGSTISVLKKKDQNSFDTRFLGKFLQSQFSVLRKKTSGTTIPHIDRSILENIFIPVLNLSDQIHIAHILSQAEVLIAQRKESIRLLDELVKSKFLEMFGDPIKNEKENCLIKQLEEIVIPGRIVTYGIVQAGPHVAKGIPYIKTGDIKDGKINIENLSRTSKEIANSYKRSEVNRGDIIISIRATVGAVALLPDELDGANLTQGTARISPSAEINKYYLLYYIMSEKIQNWLNIQVKGATFKEITLSNLRKLPVLCPPVSQQNIFAKFVETIEKQKGFYLQSILDLETLYSSLSQKAFNGELTANQKSSSKVSAPRLARETSLHVIATDSNKERTTLQKIDKIKAAFSSKKEEQSFLKRKILGSYIINQSLDDSQFGDVKFEKLLHLSEYLILKRNFGQHYVQKVAGPYDNKFTILFFQQIEKDRWFRRIKEGKQFHFQQGEKHESSTKTYNYFSEEELGAIQGLIGLFKKRIMKKWRSFRLCTPSGTTELSKENRLKTTF